MLTKEEEYRLIKNENKTLKSLVLQLLDDNSSLTAENARLRNLMKFMEGKK